MTHAEGRHLLVVDDEPLLVRIWSDLLEGEGYTVSTASSGKEALERIAKGDVDLVLMDFGMPECNGLEVSQRIRSLRPGLPIIMITGHVSADLATAARESGAVDHFMVKPLVDQELLDLVRETLSASPRPASDSKT